MPLSDPLNGQVAGPDVAPASALLKIEHVTKQYAALDGDPVQALVDVSFDVARGEFVSILGPSGCGKSTLMMLIGGIMRPTSGSIRFDGEELTETPPGIGVVFQDAILFPWRTARQNIELPAEISRVPVGARSQELLELVGLTDFASKFPHELSGGMQQRVAIARALMLVPSLLLMDEPFGALDAMTREQMNLEIQRISLQTKATVVFVTHSIAEAAFLSDRVLVMTGRPGSIKGVVEIDIPRPRTLDLLASDRFGIYVGRLRHLLNSAGDVS